MKSKGDLKKRAIKLRKKGLSYREIGKQIPVAKSTLSLWLKNVQLSKEQTKRLYTKQILFLSLGSQSQKERRSREVKNIIESAKQEIQSPISEESYLLFGAALYWAEGTKSGGFAITNSDPFLVLFMVKWIEKIFDIKPNQLKAWLNIYSQQNEKELKNFWSELTNIPIQNFGKSYIKPVNKNYKKNNLYYGTIKVCAPKSIDLVHKIFGWTNGVLQNIETEVKSGQKKWERLKNVERPVNLKESGLKIRP